MKLRVFLWALAFCSGALAQTTVVETTNTNNNNTVEEINSTTRNENISTSKSEQILKTAPPTAIAPAMMSGGGNDLCTTGVSGAVQTQILGISAGSTVRDMNCERLKLSKLLYDMGMKVAAVSTMCQDERVFTAMMNAGTPCPIDGKIGAQAKALWEIEKEKQPKEKEMLNSDEKGYVFSFGGLLLLLLAL